MAVAMLAACAQRGVPHAMPVSPQANDAGSTAGTTSASPDRAAPAIDPKHLHVVLVNGGGNRSGNYQSHMIHVRAMLAVLEAANVPHDQITIFASDGEDPGEDLAVRELRPEGEDWLLEGTPLEGTLAHPMEYVSSSIPGYTLQPAKSEALRAWFDGAGKKIPPGDTLLLYVTDHGTPNRKDPSNTAITLWGDKQSFSVHDLNESLAALGPRVRVVMLMSQCFSGGFANIIDRDPATTPDELPSGDVCGYFSSTQERPAYGCYPENRGNDNVGHSVRFIESLAANGSFPAAEAHTLVVDRTPDVPLTTFDVQIKRLLERAAAAESQNLTPFADPLLSQAWRDPARYEPQIRLLDRMGQSFGFASPRSLAEVDERLQRLPTIADTIGTHAQAWSETLDDATRANLTRFLDANPGWQARVAPEKLRGLSPDAARALGSELLAALGPYTDADPAMTKRIELLAKRSDLAGAISYRMEVREAGLLRMRALLLRIAGQVYLETRASDAERKSFAALARCEDLDLGVHAAAAAPPRDDLPSYDDDLAQAKTVLPAWMGIQFRPASGEERTKDHLPSGAVAVRVVYPDSPAAKAGLEVGDVLLGPPGKPFTEPRQVREWTMLQEVGKPRTLEVLHDGKRVERTLVPGEHPGKFPDLPSPPKVGSKAPALHLTKYRETPPTTLADGKTHLLFFWATWCGPCKASLPEVMDFARERGVQVVAITDEDSAQLDRFFAKFEHDFPPLVAIDAKRDAFLDYGVSGTPTFVLIDGDGVVRSLSTGYSPGKGLQIDGWTWKGKPAAGH